MSIENFAGRRAWKRWSMQPKDKAGRGSPGNKGGAWRSFRKPKVEVTPKKEKREKRTRH